MLKKCWREIPEHYPNVVMDEYVIMSDHLHGVLVINGDVGADAGCEDVVCKGVQLNAPTKPTQYRH